MKFFGHLKTVLTHKYWVFRYTLIAGIPWRGLVHDLSKFSPVEWRESVRYYAGSRSPVHYARAANRFSNAWLHHRGRNRHHFEYWVDNTANGGLIAVPMPFLDALELICDRLGAARAYKKRAFSMAEQLFLFNRDIAPSPLVHPQTKLFIRFMFEALAAAPNRRAVRAVIRSARKLYDKAWDEVRFPEEPGIVRVEAFIGPKPRG
jgi:hypothetical protein